MKSKDVASIGRQTPTWHIPNRERCGKNIKKEKRKFEINNDCEQASDSS